MENLLWMIFPLNTPVDAEISTFPGLMIREVSCRSLCMSHFFLLPLRSLPFYLPSQMEPRWFLQTGTGVTYRRDLDEMDQMTYPVVRRERFNQHFEVFIFPIILQMRSHRATNGVSQPILIVMKPPKTSKITLINPINPIDKPQ